MTKEIVFSAFKFDLLTYEEKDSSFEFDGPKPSNQELIEKKNEIYKSVIESLSEHKTDKNMFKMIDNDKNIYLFKISNKKTTSLVQDFSIKKVHTEPYVYLVIDNNPDIQRIYISEAAEVFKTINTTKNILLKIFNRHLHLEFLKIEMKEVFDKKDFWTLLKDNPNKINYLNIEFVKPSSFDKSKNLNESFQNFAGKTNAFKSSILLKASERSILKNISQSNRDLNNLVELCSENGGEIKVKFLGARKQLSTKSSIKKIKIDESHLEKIDEKLIKIYLDVFTNN